MSKDLNLIFLGPPGAGKGTQAQRVVEKYRIPQISTGDLIRATVASGDELAQKLKSYMSAGALVPDELVLDILLKRISKDDCQNGFLLDGFPRTIAQAKDLEKLLEKKNAPLSGVICIEVPDEVLTSRLTARRICSECGASYHLEFLKPKKEGICDKCGSKLYQRKDDSKEVILNRLKVYHDQTSPLIQFYQEKGLLHRVDGDKKIDMIFKEICDIIENLNSP
ncbi:MAG: adenylate kinase [Candidatus Rifleibacteriota bacterium]